MARPKKDKRQNDSDARTFAALWDNVLRDHFRQLFTLYVNCEPPPFARHADGDVNYPLWGGSSAPGGTQMMHYTPQREWRTNYITDIAATPHERVVMGEMRSLLLEYRRLINQDSYGCCTSGDVGMWLTVPNAMGRQHAPMWVLGESDEEIPIHVHCEAAQSFLPRNSSEQRMSYNAISDLANESFMWEGHTKLPMVGLRPSAEARQDSELSQRITDLTVWAVRHSQRRHGAMCAAAFFLGLRSIPNLGTRSVLREFPWIREVAAALGGEPAEEVRRSDLPYRGYDDNLVRYLNIAHEKDVRDYGFGNLAMPSCLVSEMRLVGKAIHPLLVRMLLLASGAKQHRQFPHQPWLALTASWGVRHVPMWLHAWMALTRSGSLSAAGAAGEASAIIDRKDIKF